jgi:hypothetical protein
VPAVEVTDHRRRLEVTPRQRQGVSGHGIEAGQPDAGVMLAALGHHIRKDIELRQHGIEP